VVVVLDGANVSRQKNGVTSIPKLAAAIEYFYSGACASSKFPVKCVAFVPNFWLNAKPSAGVGTGGREPEVVRADEWKLLQQLVDSDHVTLTPSQAHDDFYVIDYAVKYDGFIVTNDMFRDHVANKVGGSSKPRSVRYLRPILICVSFPARLSRQKADEGVGEGALYRLYVRGSRVHAEPNRHGQGLRVRPDCGAPRAGNSNSERTSGFCEWWYWAFTFDGRKTGNCGCDPSWRRG
jgi:hypothetical protein